MSIDQSNQPVQQINHPKQLSHLDRPGQTYETIDQFEERILGILKELWQQKKINRWNIKTKLASKISWKDFQRIFLTRDETIGDLMIEYSQVNKPRVKSGKSKKRVIRKNYSFTTSEESSDDSSGSESESEKVVCEAIIQSGKRKGKKCGNINCKIKAHAKVENEPE